MPAGEAAPPTWADTIAWNWVIEELADCKEFDPSNLSALLRWYPSIISDPIYGPATRERLILRYLEELVDSTESLPSSPQPKFATGTPVPGSNVLDCGINDGPWSESTLCHLLQKVGGLKSTGECIDESCRSVLRQIILQKRHALPKTSLDLLKDSILEDCRQGVSSSNKFSCLGKGDKLNSLHSQNVNDSEIASKKLKLSNSHVEQVKLLSPSKTNQRLLLAEDSSRHEQQSKQNRQNVEISVDDNNTTSTKQNITPVSLVEKNKKLQSSSKMKTGDDIHIPDVLSDGGQKVLSELSNSHVEQVKLLSPSKTNQRLLLAEDSSRHEQQSKQNRQNVQISVDDNNTTSTKQNITPVSLVEKNKKLQSSSKMKTGDDIHIPDVLSDDGQKVLSESSSDVGGYDDAIPDFHPNDEILAAEKLKLLNSQHPVNNHSQIGDWTQKRSCIKCDEGGQVLICTGSECPIAVHESCLGSSIDIENPEDFKCPFCSYLLAASAYYEARKKVSVARQTLSSFMGRERVGQKTVSPPPLTRESSHARKPSNGNHPDRVCANHRREIVKEPGRQNQAKAPIGNNDNLHAREEHPLMGRTDDAAATSGETETVNECHVLSKSQHQEHAVAADESHVVSKPQHQEQAVPDEIHEECEKVIEQDPAIEHDVDRQKRSKICSGEHSSSSQDSKHQISTRRFRRYSNPLFPYARRNRLPWTSEEEATLKEAMQIFYQSGEKGISWVKIWEFGRHKFHKTRRPADLKDKWRNIRKREG